MAPAQLAHDHRALEDQLLAFLVAERDGPATLLVEAVERLDKVAEERVAALLAVGDHIDAGVFLHSDRGLDVLVFLVFEPRRVQLARVVPPAELDQRGGPQEAADDLSPNPALAHPA